jgi:hypothetical protein
MSTQYRLVQSGKTASGGCSAGQVSSEPVAPRILLFIIFCTNISFAVHIYHHYHHHHDVAIKELGHLLTRSSLTHPEVPSVAFLGSFCLLGCSYQSGQSVTWHSLCTFFIFIFIFPLFNIAPESASLHSLSTDRSLVMPFLGFNYLDAAHAKVGEAF